MGSNSIGSAFVVTTFGESHGPAIGCVIDGCPPGVPLPVDMIRAALARRRPGQSDLTTSRQESDEPEILSGLDAETSRTLGTPIAIVIRNSDARSDAYLDLRHRYRPGHADHTFDAKYGIRAWQGGGRASARETAARVAAGAVAEAVLAQRFPDMAVLAWVESIHDVDARTRIDATRVTRQAIDAEACRCPDPESAARMAAAIRKAKADGDSVGGIMRLVVRGVPAGLGDPVFDKLTALLAQAMLSIPACKGIEFGSGFAAATATGAANNDPLRWKDGRLVTTSNHAGGINGGISNGMPLDLRLVFKPTATVLVAQTSADDAGSNCEVTARGRHDPCVLPRAVPVVEAMASLVLCDRWLAQRSQVGDPWSGLRIEAASGQG